MAQNDHDAILGRFEGKRHIYPLIVYYENTDAGGVVYHANYLAFAERARSAMLNLLGFTNRNIAERHKVAIAVRQCTLDFRRPALLEDRITVESRVIKVGGASLGFEQKIMRGDDELVVIEIYLACMSLEEFRAQRLPDELRTVFNSCLDVTKD
ncbi:YbgC/FadM family acyl-CoA thioesterase [Thalassospira tepidiphila]|uniref:Thioesterase n=2 Tax=Thalassospira tepidiphila TaxID=393657 RepID=A0A853L097_9PROT|nr:YbgC/FadM family acyl-CoA thioesterase [Thalassospira tepidiphila]NJB74878.1 acyl-CoA thioester hydrolase [Thalassospira tepidiphila]OAZ10279.1 thioesterase [Thalassospira tepidiphila MCCC 1A03514]BDW89452.1 4-hydroxybenzoyl-CoA thioesterase [Thalassospira tepidiphila]